MGVRIQGAFRPSPLPEVELGLTNRHLLPRVAFGVLLGVSLAGTAITVGTHGAGFAVVLLRWAYLVSAAVVAGGSLWWAAFVREEPEARDRQAVDRFARREAERFLRILPAAAAGLVVSSLHLLWLTRPGVSWLVGLLEVLVAAVAVLTASLTLCPRHRTRGWRDGRRWVLLVSSAGLLAGTGALDAALQVPGNAAAAGLRSAHVVAFGLWLGGAAWNLWAAIPAAQEDPRVPVVVAAARQLERFRWTVRVALPTLAVTGVLQAVPYAGGSFAYLAGTWVGRVILVKAGALVILIGIFITCPLWRACSPVRGMCNLRDLEDALPRPARTLDNRGKPCAGFVHVQRALRALEPGQVLELLSTDPMSWWELPAWARQNGYEVLDQRVVGRYRLLWRTYRFFLRRAVPAAPPEERTALRV
ncbi:MAG: sulfurtransferase TusA family protein [Armatimonadota bacterium]|nr:sulfurtransferase TusA family protein [Armatimonadota bacterium]MDR7445194.1 sulfurtransferase TusA family protein [Armatimonadota bacterium]MDR7571097.1 sulfurtransferase TusA family protein [Armatimonadota bacterium]MDR7613705.1 sulfurtransferase TusA family protein [Armatimonadota bacterium]